MPLYDCMLLLKPTVSHRALLELVSRIGKHVYRRNGVITGVKSFGSVQLGYGIKKLDVRYYRGQLMQMTMMTPLSFNSELHYLNKEDRLLRWLLVKHRDVKLGAQLLNDDYEDDSRNLRVGRLMTATRMKMKMTMKIMMLNTTTRAKMLDGCKDMHVSVLSIN